MRLAHRALSQAADYAARREEATALAVSVEPKLTSLVKCVKHLQKQVGLEATVHVCISLIHHALFQVTADISKRYNNRVVNIIGEINQI